MKNNKFLLVLLMSINFLFAQEFKLGKVSIAELQEKEHPKDPSAAAAILFKKGTVKYDYSQEKGFEVKTEVKTRIKIYKKEGYEYANNMVQYSNYGKENVSFDDAATYNLVDGKIEKTKLKSDGEFDEKINKYWNRKKISLPNVKVGSVIEFSYVINAPAKTQLKDWNFQYDIPVNHSEFKTFIPEYFKFKPAQKGFIFPKTTVEKNNRKVNYTYTQANEQLDVYSKNGVNQRSAEELNFIETITDYVMIDVPALKQEDFVNNIENYTASVSNELSYIAYPNQPIKSIATSWTAVAKSIYDNEDFGDELNKTDYFENDLKPVLANLTDRNEKIVAVLNFIRQKTTWNKLPGYSCDEGVKKAYKIGTGNTADINLMLTAMLRFAGFEANPVLISTRSNGIAAFASRNAFNAVIAAIETSEGLILIDATDKYSTPNILPIKDLNWFGRLIRKDGTTTDIELMPKTTSTELNNMNVIIKPTGTCEGKLKQYHSRYNALNYRSKYGNSNKESYVELLETKNNNIEISDYERENESDLGEPVIETFNFKDTKSVEIINNKIYLSPMLFLAQKENPFKQETREYPIDFTYPKEQKFNINIEIPEGYVLDSQPKPASISMADNIGTFKYLIQNTDNKIQVVITSTINESIVPSDYYSVLKDFYKQIIEKQNEKIVLVKK